jgi:hypothetical protein
MKKIISILAILSFAYFFTACGSSEDTTSKITIGFEPVPLSSASGGSAAAIPDDVSTLDVKVYSDSVSLSNLVQSFSFNKIDLSSERISVNALPGDNRIFELTAKNIRGLTIYKGTSSTLNLTAGKEESLIIQMQQVVMSMNANLKISLVDISIVSGVTTRTPYQNPGYLNPTGTIIVEVYKPSYVDGVYDMGSVLSTVTANFGSTDTFTEITGAAAYPDTYQLVMVKAMTLDGTIAAIGGVGVDSLKEGDNSITSGMTPPGRVKFVSSTTISTMQVNMTIGGTSYSVATMSKNSIFQGNSIIALIPNAMADFGKDILPSATLTINYTVNGTSGSKTFDQTVNPLKWGEMEIDL